VTEAGRRFLPHARAVLAAEARHGAYFADLDQQAVLDQAGVDLDNLVTACRRASTRGDAATAAKALQGAWAGLALRGPFRVGVELASLVQAIPTLSPTNAAIVNWVAGCSLALLGKVADARTALENSLMAASEAGDRAIEARTLCSVGDLDARSANAESAYRHLELGLAIAAELRDRALQSSAELGLGLLQILVGKPKEASSHYEKALTLAKEAGDRRLEVSALANLGTVEVSGINKARFYCEAALGVARDSGDRSKECNTLCNLGLLDYYEGRTEDAREHLEMALVVARELGNVLSAGNVLCNLGMVHEAMAHLDEAESQFDAAVAIAREIGDRRMEGQVLGYLGELYARRSRFDDARSRLDAGEALLRAVSDQMSLGLLLCNRAEAERLAGSPATAGAALSAAEKIAVEVSAGTDSELGLALTRLRGLAETPPTGQPP